MGQVLHQHRPNPDSEINVTTAVARHGDRRGSDLLLQVGDGDVVTRAERPFRPERRQERRVETCVAHVDILVERRQGPLPPAGVTDAGTVSSKVWIIDHRPAMPVT